MLAPDFRAMPPELRSVPRWVTHRRKVPFCPTLRNAPASVTDPSTWGSFAQAETAFGEGGRDGVGFVLAGDGFAAIDLDHVIDNGGKPQPAALDLLGRIGAQYIEFSPGGAGVHAWGTWPHPFAGKRGTLDGISIEIYSRARYLTVTGRPLPGKAGALVPLDLGPLFDRLGSSPTEEGQKRTEDGFSHPPFSSVGIPAFSLPASEGERNKRLFDLARWLRGKRPDASRVELRAIVQEWHRLALPVVGTKDFAASWSDFLHGWKRVKCPHGSILTGIIQGIDFAEPLPPRIEALGYGDAGNRLYQICSALQAHAGDEPFFISARQAGELTGIHFTDASKVLSAMVADGVLELVSRGAGRVASRYRFTSEPRP